MGSRHVPLKRKVQIRSDKNCCTELPP